MENNIYYERAYINSIKYKNSLVWNHSYKILCIIAKMEIYIIAPTFKLNKFSRVQHHRFLMLILFLRLAWLWCGCKNITILSSLTNLKKSGVVPLYCYEQKLWNSRNMYNTNTKSFLHCYGLPTLKTGNSVEHMVYLGGVAFYKLNRDTMQSVDIIRFL